MLPPWRAWRRSSCLAWEHSHPWRSHWRCDWRLVDAVPASEASNTRKRAWPTTLKQIERFDVCRRSHWSTGAVAQGTERGAGARRPGSLARWLAAHGARSRGHADHGPSLLPPDLMHTSGQRCTSSLGTEEPASTCLRGIQAMALEPTDANGPASSLVLVSCSQPRIRGCGFPGLSACQVARFALRRTLDATMQRLSDAAKADRAWGCLSLTPGT